MNPSQNIDNGCEDGSVSGSPTSPASPQVAHSPSLQFAASVLANLANQLDGNNSDSGSDQDSDSAGTTTPQQPAPRRQSHANPPPLPPTIPWPNTFQTREIGHTGTTSGLDLMAIFIGTNGEPRTRYALRILRGRGPGYLPHVTGYPSSDVVIPGGLTLQEIAQRYPRHAWGTGLRLFMAGDWDAQKVYKALPAAFQTSQAQDRAWNYLQQGYTRETRRMREEDAAAARAASMGVAPAAQQQQQQPQPYAQPQPLQQQPQQPYTQPYVQQQPPPQPQQLQPQQFNVNPSTAAPSQAGTTQAWAPTSQQQQVPAQQSNTWTVLPTAPGVLQAWPPVGMAPPPIPQPPAGTPAIDPRLAPFHAPGVVAWFDRTAELMNQEDLIHEMLTWTSNIAQLPIQAQWTEVRRIQNDAIVRHQGVQLAAASDYQLAMFTVWLERENERLGPLLSGGSPGNVNSP